MMEREAKTKVVSSVWGTNFVQSLLRLLFCLRQFGRNGEIILFFEIDRGKAAIARQGIEQKLSFQQTQRPLPLLLSPSFFYVQQHFFRKTGGGGWCSLSASPGP